MSLTHFYMTFVKIVGNAFPPGKEVGRSPQLPHNNKHLIPFFYLKLVNCKGIFYTYNYRNTPFSEPVIKQPEQTCSVDANWRFQFGIWKLSQISHYTQLIYLWICKFIWRDQLKEMVKFSHQGNRIMPCDDNENWSNSVIKAMA